MAHAPERQPVAIPLGNTAAWLHWNGDTPGKSIRELLNDVGFRKTFLEIALLIRPSCLRIVLWRVRRPKQIPFTASKIGCIGRHGVFERRRKRKHLILNLDGPGGILREILTFGGDNGNRFTLKIQFFAQRLGNDGGRTTPGADWDVALPFGCILIRKDIRNTRHLFRGRGVDVLDPRMRMRRRKKCRI